jgi:hypothetical protein
MEKDFELADVGVVRGAAWPIESLDRFGTQELVELALSSTDSRDDRIYLSKYAEIFDREREILWEITAADDRFAKALMLSNRLVADKVRAYIPTWQQQPRNKIIRRLEHTLYRYLARAVGRTTPNGLWAGVCLFDRGDRSECVERLAEYAFAPDLRPFQSILSRLGKRSIYRESSYWQVNPTLKRLDRTWQFWARNPTDEAGWCQIAANESIDLCLQTIIDLPPLLWSEIVNQIALLTPTEAGNWLDKLIDVGAIVGSLDLPTRFDTVWDGLVESGEKLIDADRDLWYATLDRLTFLCFDLSISWDEIEMPRLGVYLDEAREAISNLVVELAIPIEEIELPDAILHCDLRLPWQITLDCEKFDRLATTIATYNRDWLDRTSPSMQLRRQQRANLQSQLTEGIALNSIDFTSQIQTEWEEIKSVTMKDPIITNCLQNWTELLNQSTENVYLKTEDNLVIDRLATAPLGCFYFTPLADWQLVVSGIDDDPARAFARFGKLLDSNDELSDWLRQALTEIESKHQLTFVELQVPFESNPNVIARCKFVEQTIDLWSVNPQGLSLRSARIEIEPLSQTPVLSIPSLPDPIAIFFFSTANIGAIDPIANLLLHTGFQERPSYFQSIEMSTVLRSDTTICTPRIKLESGEIIRPRRTVLDRESIQKIIYNSPPERYQIWQQMAQKFGWSKLVNLQVDRQPSLLIKSDSPLALEAAFKSLKPDTQSLIIEEVIDLPWVIDRDGKHYFAEFAMPFQRSKHGWSDRLQSSWDK